MSSNLVSSFVPIVVTSQSTVFLAATLNLAEKNPGFKIGKKMSYPHTFKKAFVDKIMYSSLYGEVC